MEGGFEKFSGKIEFFWGSEGLIFFQEGLGFFGGGVSLVNYVCRSAYFHLRNIGSVRNMLSDDACSQLIHALVTVRIDYCNSLLYGLPEYSLDRLQKILNTAARILRRVPKFDHITETLMDLHWLPVHQRVTFKILILTYQAYHGTAPQ